MTELNHSRRDMLKQTGLGLGVAAAAPWAATSLLTLSRVEAVTAPEHYATLPVLDEVDVLVCGGGAAGIGAGLGAAQQGARTLVIENCTFFGGVISRMPYAKMEWLWLPANMARDMDTCTGWDRCELEDQSQAHPELLKRLTSQWETWTYEKHVPPNGK